MNISSNKKFRKAIKRILVFCAVLYTALCGTLYVLQQKMIFIPNANPPQQNPATINLKYESLSLKTATHSVNAWYVPNLNAKGTVLFCHGNAGNIGDRMSTISFWYEFGYNIMIFDYAGYGDSSGSSNEMNCYLGVEASLKWLYEKNIRKGDIIVHGRSLGGGVASYIAAKEKLPKLILESTFTSIPDMASYRFPFLPVRFLAKIHFPTQERLKSYGGKSLILHSANDEIVPYFMGQELAKTAQVKLIELNGGHNENQMYKPEYKQALIDFLR